MGKYPLLTIEDCEELYADFPQTMFTPEAAKLLDISVSKLYKVVCAKLIPAHKFGKGFVFIKHNLLIYKLDIMNESIEKVNSCLQQRGDDNADK